MLYYTKIYLKITEQYIKMRLHYRSDLIISAIALLFQNMLGLFSTWIIFSSIGTIEGWEFYQLSFLYSFAMLATIPQQLLLDNLWALSEKVRSGEFIKYYFRPINMLFYYLTEVFDLKSIGTLAINIAIMVISIRKLGLHFGAAQIILLVCLIIGASMVMISLMLATASLSFFIIAAINAIEFVNNFRDLARFPLNIYDKALRFLFTFILPIGFIAYYPTRIILWPESISPIFYFTPLLGTVMFFFAYQVWKKGVNSYSGTGS